jgi:hypothetical protein
MVASQQYPSSVDWLERTRHALYDHWVKKTGHHPNAATGTWACEIAHGCRICNEHLSVPCSLLKEANEIGLFLSLPCFDENRAETFLRLYLILLSEFVQQLNDLGGLLSLQMPKTPRMLNIWANHWAKHRLKILVQHHPKILFSDAFSNSSTVAEDLPDWRYECRNGSSVPLAIIDTTWLASVGKTPDLPDANAGQKAVILVPSLRLFLDETVDHFREFIDRALKNENAVRRFESRAGCI